MTFEELSAAPPSVQHWYAATGYRDAPWCRERADDWCEAPVLTPAKMAPVSEPGAALMLACGLIGVAIVRRLQCR